jgi:hypothetical protein
LSAKNIGVPAAWRRGIIEMVVARRGQAMADSCPILKVSVKTGLTTETIVFVVLDRSAVSLPGLSRGSLMDAEGCVGG